MNRFSNCIFQINGKFYKIKVLKNYWIQVVKDMKILFQSCLKTNSSGIGIARVAECPICKVCSNLIHCIEADNSYIALQFAPEAVFPAITITPVPVGDVIITGQLIFNGRFGPSI